MTTFRALAMVVLAGLVVVAVVCIVIWAGEAAMVVCLGMSGIGVTLLWAFVSTVIYPLLKGK